ncbi:MAG TPA: class II fructose-bisphosphatase [Candidatus Dormibacteraeota bacterium]|nr:class II fructose-bisphosphatase [Candidatus Dormibacteraeota bacterium]
MKSDVSTPASGGASTPRTVQPNLGLELVRATEAAALSAGRWMGNLDREGIRGTAANAMREALTGVHMSGTIVIGEESPSAPLGLGQLVGDGSGDACDVALKPLDGSTLVAKGLPNAVSVVATVDRGSLVRAPVGMYAEKIAVGPEARGSIDVTDSVENNLQRVAFAKKVQVSDLTVVMLDRPRHEPLMDQVRQVGARITLLSDGDIAAAIMATLEGTGIDVMLGIGGLPEAVLAACALKCLGGDLQCRLWLRSRDDEEKARAAGFADLRGTYSVDDLVRGEDVAFAATGVTDGEFLHGVIYHHFWAETESMVFRSKSGTVRHLNTKHHYALKSVEGAHRKVR